uniref:SANT domain-containing protein n=1 Tax=Panagrellus redivivus TaxID=6233 RepID=A0A7E4VN10_PANRE
MKRPAPSDNFDDSFDDDDDALFAFEVPEDVPSTSTTPPPPKFVMPSPPKRAFVFRPSQPVKLNTFNSDSALPGIEKQNENGNRSAFSSSVGAQGQAAGGQNRPGPSGSVFSNQGKPMGAGQSQFRPPGAVGNQPRPTVPVQSQVRPNSVFRNQPWSNAVPQNQPRPPYAIQTPFRPSQTSTLQRSTSVQNPPPQNITSQNRPNPPTRPVNPQSVHPSQPHFQQAFRPPGGPFPPLPNATKVNIPRPQNNNAQTPSSSQFQRTVSFPPPGSTQGTQNQNQNPVRPPPRTNSQFPNIPTKEQVMQWRAAAAVATQRWYGPSQQQRYQRPMLNQSRGPGPSQMSQRPGMGLNQTQQRFMAPNQTPRFMTSQAQQRFMNQTPQRPGMPSNGQRQMGPIQRPPFRPIGSGQRPPVPVQSQRPVPNETVPQSQSPFSVKSSLSTSSGGSDLPPAAKEEISRLKGAIEFLEVKYKTKDRDHNVLAFKFKNEVTSRKDLSTEIDRLKAKNDELNQQFIKEQMEKASLQAALEKAQADAAAARKEKALKSPPAFPVPTVVKAKFPPSIEEVKAAGQLAQQPVDTEPEAENGDNDDAVTVADAEEPAEPTKPLRWCEPEDVLSRLSYRKEMEFFLECPDLKKPKVNIHEVIDKYRTFFNLKNLERDPNGAIIPPPHVGAAKDAKSKKKKKQPEKPAEKQAPPPPEPPKPTPPPPDAVFKVPELPKRLQQKMTRTNLRLPPSFRITVPKKRFKKPLGRGQTERPIETEEEKKEREIKEKEEDEKKRLIELEKAKARRKLLNINRKSKKSAVPEPPPPPPKWTPILSLTEMAKPRVLRPYEKKEAAVKKAKEHAEARAEAAALAEEVDPVEQMEVDRT